MVCTTPPSVSCPEWGGKLAGVDEAAVEIAAASSRWSSWKTPSPWSTATCHCRREIGALQDPEAAVGAEHLQRRSRTPRPTRRRLYGTRSTRPMVNGAAKSATPPPRWRRPEAPSWSRRSMESPTWRTPPTEPSERHCRRQAGPAGRLDQHPSRRPDVLRHRSVRELGVAPENVYCLQLPSSAAASDGGSKPRRAGPRHRDRQGRSTWPIKLILKAAARSSARTCYRPQMRRSGSRRQLDAKGLRRWLPEPDPR